MFVEDNSIRISQSIIQRGLFRPSGFLLEPAHNAQLAVVALAVTLFKDKSIITKSSIIVTIGCILSTSGMGIALVLGVWIYYLITMDISIRKKMGVLGIGAVSIPFIILILSKFTFFQMAIARVTGGFGVSETAYSGRTYYSYLLDDFSFLQKLFGMGYNNIPIVSNITGQGTTTAYMIGILKIRYCLGLIGVVLFLIACILFTIKSNNYKKIIMIAYIGLFFVADVVNPYTIFFYLAIIMCPSIGKYGGNEVVGQA